MSAASTPSDPLDERDDQDPTDKPFMSSIYDVWSEGALDPEDNVPPAE